MAFSSYEICRQITRAADILRRKFLETFEAASLEGVDRLILRKGTQLFLVDHRGLQMFRQVSHEALSISNNLRTLSRLLEPIFESSLHG